MNKYKGLYTFDIDTHRYVPVEQAKEILEVQGLKSMKGTYEDVVTAYNMSKALLETLISREDAEAMDFAIYYDLVNSKPEDNLVHYETLRGVMDRAIKYIKENENDKSRKEESKGSEDPR